MAAPNLKEIESAIYELEHEESSRSGYGLLAALYTCRNEMLGLTTSQPQSAPWIAACSEASAPMTERLDLYGDSDFLRTVADKDPAAAWGVMNAHIETLCVVNPRDYEGVMRKLRNL